MRTSSLDRVLKAASIFSFFLVEGVMWRRVVVGYVETGRAGERVQIRSGNVGMQVHEGCGGS